jgi:hypothetical protein
VKFNSRKENSISRKNLRRLSISLRAIRHVGKDWEQPVAAGPGMTKPEWDTTMRVTIQIEGHKDSMAGVLPDEKYLTGIEKIKEALVRAGVILGGERLDSSRNREDTHADYSEEAIPERDPAHSTLHGTLYETQTVEDVPAYVRLDLARQLKELGMSPVRAAMVASL